MGTWRKRIGALTALALVSGLVAGCGTGGQDSGGNDAATVFATASAVTQQARTAKLDLTETVVSNGDEQAFSGVGSVDLAHKSSEITADLGDELGQLKVKFVGGDMYLQTAEMDDGLGGHWWAKVDMDRFSKATTGESFSDLSAGQGMTAAGSALESLEAATNVKKVGTEQIGGVATNEYRADMDPAKMKRVGTEARRSLSSMLSTTGMSFEPLHVWIDDDGLPRRLRMTITIDAGESGGSGHVVATMDYRDWGADISIGRPPLSDTKDVTHDVIAELDGS